MTAQAQLELIPLVTPEPATDLTIQQQYERWIDLNNWVLAAVESLIADWLAAGHKRVSTKTCFELIRYSYGVTVGSPFKMDNNFTSRVARTVLDRHPEWASAISTRELRAA